MQVRRIQPLEREQLRGVTPAMPGNRPRVAWIDPRGLWVEERYQREFGRNGLGLARRIVAGFSWLRFKPPICCQVGERLVVIDGQHTAIGAASNPNVPEIPVLVIEAPDMQERAGAFVGHNVDRLFLTMPAIFQGRIAAGDKDAVGANAACLAAGARIIGKPINLANKTPIGDTIAVSTILKIYQRQGAAFLEKTMRVLVEAKRGPVKADEIAGVALIFLGTEDLVPRELVHVVASKSAQAWAAIAAMAAADNRDPIPSALASVWCRELGLRLQVPKIQRTSKSQATRMITASAPTRKKAVVAPPATSTSSMALRPAAPPPRPPAAPRAPIAAPPVAKRLAPAPAAAPSPIAPGVNVAQRNGVVVDLGTRRVAFRGKDVYLGDESAIRLVASLCRVMPAMLDHSRLVTHAFGSAAVLNGAERLSLVIDAVNSDLRPIGLEVRRHGRMGCNLYDLGG